jgi:hypothetical protein
VFTVVHTYNSEEDGVAGVGGGVHLTLVPARVL